MDFSLSAAQLDLKRRAEEAALEWRDQADKWDLEDEAPYDDVVKRLGELGLLGLTMPQEYGGQGGTALDYLVVVEEIFRTARSWVVAEPLFATSGPGPTVLLLSEQEETKRKFVPAIVAGEKGCGIALTEPNHGSDVTHLETSAVLDGDEFVINGSKRFITGAPHNELYVVFARLTDDPGARGIGALVVEKGMPGFRLERGARFVGSRGLPHGELYFDNCRVPRENLVVDAGQFPRLMMAFNMERLHNSAYHLGYAQAAYEETVKYVETRRAFDRDIIEFQSVYHALADMWVEIEALRLLTYRAAATAIDGVFPQALEVTASKLYGCTMLSRLTTTGIELHGGDGATLDYPIQRIHREALAAMVAGGAPALLRNTIAGQLFPHRRFAQTR